MKLRDRLTGEDVDANSVAAERTHLGRWLIDGRYLVGDDHGAWSLSDENGQAVSGSMFADAWPDESTLDALGLLGAEIDALGDSWSDWVGICPLAPDLDRAVEPRPLARLIDLELEHLEGVFREPSSAIRHDAMAVPVGRARKLAPKALAHLATHSEDWGRRTLLGVQPRRLLALVREEQLALYENRVAVKLLDVLVTWLLARRRELHRLRDEILAELDSSDLHAGSHRRRQRLCSIWGEAFTAKFFSGKLYGVLADTEDRLRKLLRLKNSRLYRALAPIGHMDAHLHMTNLFESHEHYQGVARLWRGWIDARPAPITTADERAAQARRRCEDLDAWAWLLTIRACDQLGLRPENPDVARPEVGHRLALEDGFELELTDYGTMVVYDRGHARIQLIAVMQALEHEDQRATESRVRPLISAVNGGLPWRVILHLGQARTSALSSMSTPPAPGLPGAIDFVRVSPFALDSIERVARALRWAIYAPRMLEYPPMLDADASMLVGWPIREVAGRPALVRRPHRRQRSELAERVEARAREFAAHEHQHEQIVNERARSLDDKTARARLNRDKTLANQRVQTARRELECVRSLARRVAEVDVQLEWLARCPVCRAPTQLDPHGLCFAASCSDLNCGTRWSLDRDAESGERIPVLVAGSTAELPWRSAPSARLAEDTVGEEILALPYRAVNGQLRHGRWRQRPEPDEMRARGHEFDEGRAG